MFGLCYWYPAVVHWHRKQEDWLPHLLYLVCSPKSEPHLDQAGGTPQPNKTQFTWKIVTYRADEHISNQIYKVKISKYLKYINMSVYFYWYKCIFYRTWTIPFYVWPTKCWIHFLTKNLHSFIITMMRSEQNITWPLTMRAHYLKIDWYFWVSNEYHTCVSVFVMAKVVFAIFLQPLGDMDEEKYADIFWRWQTDLMIWFIFWLYWL